MENEERVIELTPDHRSELVQAKIIKPDQASMPQKEYAAALEALRQMKLADAKDSVERLSTGLQNAQGVIDGIRAKQRKVHRPPNTPDMPIGDPDEMAAEEWKKYEQPLTEASKRIQQAKAAAGKVEQASRLVQLDPTMVLRIELTAAKKRAAVAEESLAILALQEARKAKDAAEREEALLMRAVSAQLGVTPGKNVRLVDKEKGICQIEG
jgi:hypothetical protein